MLEHLAHALARSGPWRGALMLTVELPEVHVVGHDGLRLYVGPAIEPIAPRGMSARELMANAGQAAPMIDRMAPLRRFDVDGAGSVADRLHVLDDVERARVQAALDEAYAFLARWRERLDERTRQLGDVPTWVRCPICTPLVDAFPFWRGTTPDGEPQVAEWFLGIVNGPESADMSDRGACTKRCPWCATSYRWKSDYEYLVNGASETETTLTRLDRPFTAGGRNMEAFITALTEMVRRDPRAPDGARPIKADLSDAPASVRALADALASSRYSIDLGGFHVVNETGPVITLAPAFEMATDAGIDDLDGLLATAGPGGAPLVIARSVLLAYDGGGMSALGVTWAGGVANLVIVEMEDPTEDNLVASMATPAAVFERLDRINDERKAKDLEALRATFMPAPAPAPATPASRLSAWTGAAQPHPFAHARAQYPKGNVLQCAPTAGGAVVITRRVAAGTVTAALAVHAAGTTTELDWPATSDVPAFCPVPGRERVLVHVGAMAGTLVELDLASGTQRTVLEKVGWSSGFVDANHVAVLADRELRVYRWSDGALGEPVATLPALMLNNIFVAHGCLIGKTSDYSRTTFQVLRWNGATLDDRGEHAVEPKLFTLHAAAVVDGAPLVAGVAMNGDAHWFTLDAS